MYPAHIKVKTPIVHLQYKDFYTDDLEVEGLLLSLIVYFILIQMLITEILNGQENPGKGHVS